MNLNRRGFCLPPQSKAMQAIVNHRLRPEPFPEFAEE